MRAAKVGVLINVARVCHDLFLGQASEKINTGFYVGDKPRYLGSAADDGGEGIGARLRPLLGIADAEVLGREAEGTAQNVDALEGVVAFFLEGPAENVKIALIKSLLGAADLEKRIDFSTKASCNLIEACAHLSDGAGV